jgi:outer membrane protein assembly factor BamB
MVPGLALAADWTQWRGNDHNGIAANAPALAEAWGTNGPLTLWESDPIPAGESGGFSSVTIAGGRAYVYANWKTYDAIVTRTLDEGGLRQLGWFADRLPEELSKAMETARVSDDRAKIAPQELNVWVANWVSAHVPSNEVPRLAPIVSGRLKRGRGAIALADLEKLVAIKGREFSDQAALEAWLAAAPFGSEVTAAVIKAIPTNRPVAKDSVVCLDGSGKTLWRKEYPGRATGWGSSSTACVVGGRCYVAGDKTLYCLDAATGEGIWQQGLCYGECSSSPAVIDGVAILLGGALYGFDAVDGRLLWQHKQLEGNHGSAVMWQKDGKSYGICNTLKGLVCVEPRSGRILWTAPGGGSGTAALAGDVAVVLGERTDPGLVAYRMTPEKAEKLWSREVADRGTTPVIYNGHVYVVGANRVACWALADGVLKWEQKLSSEISSPIIVDGKLLVLVNGTLHMIRASPERYELLGKLTRVKAATCSSPSFAEGRLYLRLPKAVLCLDLH